MDCPACGERVDWDAREHALDDYRGLLYCFREDRRTYVVVPPITAVEV